jgi:hypothetical protein
MTRDLQYSTPAVSSKRCGISAPPDLDHLRPVAASNEGREGQEDGRIPVSIGVTSDEDLTPSNDHNACLASGTVEG